MKRYIRATTDETVVVWETIPEKYHPYISEVQVNHPFSMYQRKEVTTYSAIFTNEVIDYYRDTQDSYFVGLIHYDDLDTLVSDIEKYLAPFVG